jgi:cyclic pyranopterin phosphate synthase
VRVTGGEPLLREDLPTLVRMIRARTGVRDISLTTNGVLLDRHAEALARAGLDRVNISLDSLEPGRFAEITRFGALDDVWRGVRAADDAGLRPIKINTLLLDGFNDDEIDAWLDLTRERDITVRFMELMPMGRDALADVGDYLDLTALRERLERTHGLRPARPGEAHIGNGPARYWRLPGARGTVGFITPISHGYCGTCSRLRMTCTGELRACLAHDRHVGLAHAARRGDDDAIEAALRWAVGDKPFGHHWPDGQHTDTGMSELGG